MHTHAYSHIFCANNDRISCTTPIALHTHTHTHSIIMGLYFSMQTYTYNISSMYDIHRKQWFLFLGGVLFFPLLFEIFYSGCVLLSSSSSATATVYMYIRSVFCESVKEFYSRITLSYYFSAWTLKKKKKKKKCEQWTMAVAVV